MFFGGQEEILYWHVSSTFFLGCQVYSSSLKLCGNTSTQYCPLLLTPSTSCCNLHVISYIFILCLHREDYGRQCCKEDAYFTTQALLSQPCFLKYESTCFTCLHGKDLSSTLFKNRKSDRKSLCHLSQKLSNTVDFVSTESHSTIIV